MDTPDTTFIEYSKIRAIIDSTYLCVYGLVSDQKFSFCVKPGKYRLVKIVRELSDGDYWYESFPVFNSIINANANQANYIGNITLLTKEKMLDGVAGIPYFKQVNETNAGAAFGFIGGVVASLTNSSWRDKIRGYYYLTISSDNNYKSDSQKYIKQLPPET